MVESSDPVHCANTNLDTGSYATLRALAAREMRRERRDHTLSPTDLVHEAWLRMVSGAASSASVPLRLRAARSMRQVLVDHARRRLAQKRSPERESERSAPIDAEAASLDARDGYVIDVDRLLAGLNDLAPDLAAVVELRFFGGSSVEETAHALGLSPRTVKRRWQLAKGWLHREITHDDDA